MIEYIFHDNNDFRGNHMLNATRSSKGSNINRNPWSFTGVPISIPTGSRCCIDTSNCWFCDSTSIFSHWQSTEHVGWRNNMIMDTQLASLLTAGALIVIGIFGALFLDNLNKKSYRLGFYR